MPCVEIKQKAPHKHISLTHSGMLQSWDAMVIGRNGHWTRRSWDMTVMGLDGHGSPPFTCFLFLLERSNLR